MSTTILHRRGIGVPSAGAFSSVGEILIDMRSGIAYTLNDAGEVVPVGGDGGEGSGTGAGMVISPTEPVDKVDGMQWLESTTARVWVWDEDKWLEFPAAGGSVEGSGLIEVSEEPPEPPYEIGQQWFSSTDGYLYIWYGAEWVAVNMPTSSGDGGSGGSEPDAGDPYWSDVSLLINADDEVGGSTNIVDATNKHQLTVANGAKVSTLICKYGTGSIDLTGATARVSASSSFNFQPNVDMTVELWAAGPASGTNVFICFATSASAQNSRWWIETVSGCVHFYMSDGSKYASVTDPATWASYGDGWHHIAWVNHNGTVSLYIDGQSKGTPATANSAVHDTSSMSLNIGAIGTSYPFGGYIDDVRITEGVARYTSNFTPPNKHSTKEAVKRAIVIQEDIPQTQEDSNDADLS